MGRIVSIVLLITYFILPDNAELLVASGLFAISGSIRSVRVELNVKQFIKDLADLEEKIKKLSNNK